MSLIRSFIAIEIPLEIQQNIYKETSNSAGDRWAGTLGPGGKYAPDIEVPRRCVTVECGISDTDAAQRGG
jgi:hypothetical protein